MIFIALGGCAATEEEDSDSGNSAFSGLDWRGDALKRARLEYQNARPEAFQWLSRPDMGGSPAAARYDASTAASKELKILRKPGSEDWLYVLLILKESERAESKIHFFNYDLDTPHVGDEIGSCVATAGRPLERCAVP